MHAFFAYDKIYAGYRKNNSEKYYCCCRCKRRITAAVSVQHIVYIADNRVHFRCVKISAKECDRIACMCRELRKMGADITELEDGMIIRGGKKLHGVAVDSYHDHRIAMALTVAAMGADGETVISDGECCEVTYPAFAGDFRALGANISVLEK